jgi:hypothetical protein
VTLERALIALALLNLAVLLGEALWSVLRLAAG